MLADIVLDSRGLAVKETDPLAEEDTFAERLGFLVTDGEPDGEIGADVANGVRDNVDTALLDVEIVDERVARGLLVAETKPEEVLESRALTEKETEPLADDETLDDRLGILDADDELVTDIGAEVAIGVRENVDAALLVVDELRERDGSGLPVTEEQALDVLDSRGVEVSETEPLIEDDAHADRLDVLETNGEPVGDIGAVVATGVREDVEAALTDGLFVWDRESGGLLDADADDDAIIDTSGVPELETLPLAHFETRAVGEDVALSNVDRDADEINEVDAIALGDTDEEVLADVEFVAAALRVIFTTVDDVETVTDADFDTDDETEGETLARPEADDDAKPVVGIAVRESDKALDAEKEISGDADALLDGVRSVETVGIIVGENDATVDLEARLDTDAEADDVAELDADEVAVSVAGAAECVDVADAELVPVGEIDALCVIVTAPETLALPEIEGVEERSAVEEAVESDVIVAAALRVAVLVEVLVGDAVAVKEIVLDAVPVAVAVAVRVPVLDAVPVAVSVPEPDNVVDPTDDGVAVTTPDFVPEDDTVPAIVEDVDIEIERERTADDVVTTDAVLPPEVV